MLGKIGICFGLCFGIFASDVSHWDRNVVRSYVHHSDLQRRWAIAFLSPYLQSLDGSEKILDIGSGDGKISADISCFVPEGTVLGIDPSDAMLSWARKQYRIEEYPNLFFKKGGFSKPGTEGPFDWVVSLCSLHHCRDPEQAFCTMAGLLIPGGKLLILLPAMKNLLWLKARDNVQHRQPWNRYWKDVTARTLLSEEEYRDLLADSGFIDISIRTRYTLDPFVDSEEFLSFLEGTLAPVVPEEERRTFYEELLAEYIRLDPEAISSEGVIQFRSGRIEIEARKKKED